MNTHTKPPVEAQEAPLYRRTDISPEDFFQTLGRARKAVRDEIERLIEWLDSTIDVDEDSAVDDEGCDGDAEDEPSLGSLDRPADQTLWAKGSRDDTEHEHDGREPDVDDEPSLCGISAGDRMISDRDLEPDLGSFDRMMDQTKSMRARGWVTDGEINESTEEGAHKVGVL